MAPLLPSYHASSSDSGAGDLMTCCQTPLSSLGIVSAVDFTGIQFGNISAIDLVVQPSQTLTPVSMRAPGFGGQPKDSVLPDLGLTMASPAPSWCR